MSPGTPHIAAHRSGITDLSVSVRVVTKARHDTTIGVYFPPRSAPKIPLNPIPSRRTAFIAAATAIDRFGTDSSVVYIDAVQPARINHA